MNAEIKTQIRNMTAEQKANAWEIASANHEAARQEIIRTEGEISPYKDYPELDQYAEIMFYLMTNGNDELIITQEWIEQNAS